MPWERLKAFGAAKASFDINGLYTNFSGGIVGFICDRFRSSERTDSQKNANAIKELIKLFGDITEAKKLANPIGDVEAAEAAKSTEAALAIIVANEPDIRTTFVAITRDLSLGPCREFAQKVLDESKESARPRHSDSETGPAP